MDKQRLQILTTTQVEQKLQRIARELLEHHYESKELIIIGITGRGQKIASRITTILNSISTVKISLLSLTLNKDSPNVEKPILMGELKSLENKTVILIDDVINSGKTLIHAVSYLLSVEIKELNTVTLVDRKHRLFPIRANFVGLTLSTTLQEHISVIETQESLFEVYLN